MKRTLLVLMAFVVISGAFAQNVKNQPPLKGNGEVFFLETFDWENPADPKGWTAPEGYYMEDPDDNGMNFHWWGTDSLISLWTREPSGDFTTKDNGCLALFLNRYNEERDAARVTVNNSIVFPEISCANRSSVIVRFETCFMNYDSGNIWDMLLEVTVDNWVRSSTIDVGFGQNHKGRPNIVGGRPGVFEANITDIVAGMPNVQFKLTWRGTTLYFWQIDDFSLSEAWDHDLKLQSFVMEWDDQDENTAMTVYNTIPKSQLNNGSFTNFKASALNFGEYDLEGVHLELNITKNNQVIFTQNSPAQWLSVLSTDSTTIETPFTPTDFGHYKISAEYKSNETDDTPENNYKEVFFHISDSVYASADDSSEEALCWGMEAYSDRPNEAHFMGVKYPIYETCEVNSISAFIAGGLADGMIEFRMALFLVPTEGEDLTPVEWLVSDMVTLDSTMIGTWITMPLDKDGESEFLQAGDLVYVGVQYWNWHETLNNRRYENLKIGSDWSKSLKDPVSVAKGDGNFEVGGYIAERNLMCRLNLKDDSNIIDGVDVAPKLSHLGQNYPNPFSRSTVVNYELANPGDVTIEIRDLTGRKVAEINEGGKTAGHHSFQIDGTQLESGIYFYTLKSGALSETRRMVVN